MNRWLLYFLTLIPITTIAQEPGAPFFQQLDDLLPTPTETRLASGAPGPDYWQQQVDYDIQVELDEKEHRLIGEEEITYYNRSPHTLSYLWVQLDQNSFRKDSIRAMTMRGPNFSRFSYRYLQSLIARETFEGGCNIEDVSHNGGKKLQYHIEDTMMRIELPEPLEPGDRFRFRIAWNHRINNAREIWGRGGYEWFEDDKNALYTIAQWFPRLAVYNDVRGWQNKAFAGRGEFALELGDYRVEITVPADHVVAATGELQNPGKVLSKAQKKRLKEASRSNVPVLIVTREEAEANLKEGTEKRKTWVFEAENVRDFAFASSRRFVWDAMTTESDGKDVLCMSFYPPEAEPLWFRYSSQAIAHTVEVYGRMTFAYPYPVAISVNGPIGGMEYPMISFNGPRAEKDGTYTKKWAEDQRWDRSKYGLISVIIHEVGHNWFPMIINSDERQWTWMDEGLNTFVQRVAELEWEKDYPSWRGRPEAIVGYMTSDEQVPIMTNSESLLQFGNNAYAKPATALTVLRESVMGREAFDYAFKRYTNLWRFKQPQPADFFRTMEDASGIDLDWFWRGWFYTTGHVDLGIGQVTQYEMDTENPDVDKPAKAAHRKSREAPNISQIRNEAEGKEYRLNRFPELKDFYNSYDEDVVTEQDREKFESFLKGLEDWERKLLETERFFYTVELENHGLVMPIPLLLTFEDDSTESLKIPVEIWTRDARKVTRLFMVKKPLKRIEIDPDQGLADADRTNNIWPPEPVRSRFRLFKKKYGKNPMQKQRDWETKKKEKAEKEKEKAESDSKPNGKAAESQTEGDSPADPAPSSGE